MEQRYNYEEEAMIEMEKSTCEKRKVGAIVVDEVGEIIGRGHNFNLDRGSCEDSEGVTMPNVIHAEIAALDNASEMIHKHLIISSRPTKIYVTHQPCMNCMRAIYAAGITEVIEVTKGIKHDKHKLKLSLIPTQLINGVGEVMTFGANKYSKNNWRNLDDPTRYLDALMRHLEAYRSGEEFDEETGLPHLAHLATNAGFLLWFDEERSTWREDVDL